MILGTHGFYMTYDDYLQSDEWSEKRDKRKEIDGERCRICGRPMDLQVHHLNYRNVGHENIYEDLITLCKYCHGMVHKTKQTKQLARYVRSRNDNTEIFCKEYHCRDVSIGGDLNMMDKETIRAEWSRVYGDGSRAPIMDVQRYFKHIRVRVIRSMEDAGATPDEIMARGISRHMIQKYYSKPEAVERALEV